MTVFHKSGKCTQRTAPYNSGMTKVPPLPQNLCIHRKNHALLSRHYITEPENLVLRNLTRRKEQLTGNITRTKNRIRSHLNFIGAEFKSWSGSSLKIMESDAEKRFDHALSSDLRELRFLREERLRVIRCEHACLKHLKREEIQKNFESISRDRLRYGGCAPG